jgi:hypothetical protein
MPTPLGNFFMKTLIYSPLHPLLGGSFAVITVTGRKTGNLISTPINTVIIPVMRNIMRSAQNRTESPTGRLWNGLPGNGSSSTCTLYEFQPVIFYLHVPLCSYKLKRIAHL